MELVKNHSLNSSNTGLMQPPPYYKIGLGEFSGFENSDHHQRSAMDQGNINSEKSKNCGVSSSSSLSSPSSSKSDGLGYHSVMNAKGGYGTIANSAGSLLSFDQNERFAQSPFIKGVSDQDDFSIWEENLHSGYQNQLTSRCSNTISPNIQTASSYAPTSELPFGWLNADANANANATINRVEDLDRQESCLTKRPHTGENVQAGKKQCKAATKTLKSKAKDPQSMAAKNRRERISERLKTLQDLVPNGSKVDLVTMLEKAIGYVKFLQLQVKVLATDEFWPAQGGKAPDISQVKEAIDAILASQRDRNSSSSL